eukprot:11370011-Alexandrium_andersonii.AAC.1
MSTIFCCAATSRWALTSARYSSTCLCRASTLGPATGPDPRTPGWMGPGPRPTLSTRAGMNATCEETPSGPLHWPLPTPTLTGLPEPQFPPLYVAPFARQAP